MPSNLQIILTTPAAASVSVQTQKSTVSSLVIGQKATAASLASIGDVIAVAPKAGDLLQYSANAGSYVVGSLTAKGGTF